MWVLQDQGIFELGGGCAVKHCKEPEYVNEMVSYAGIDYNDQVCFLISNIAYGPNVDLIGTRQFHLICVETVPVDRKNWFCGPVCRINSGQSLKRHCIEG